MIVGYTKNLIDDGLGTIFIPIYIFDFYLDMRVGDWSAGGEENRWQCIRHIATFYTRRWFSKSQKG